MASKPDMVRGEYTEALSYLFDGIEPDSFRKTMRMIKKNWSGGEFESDVVWIDKHALAAATIA